ncbi:hypothetical protein Q7P35_002018 [Cladosporium inversicolor]
MAESRAFIHALAAVVGFIKDAEQATFALYRIACPSTPVADKSPASNLRAFEISLDILLPRIKSEADVNLAAQRISQKLESLAASSVTSQESDSSQQDTNSSSSTSSTQVGPSSSSAEAEPTLPSESEVPKSASTNSAISTITQSRQCSASTTNTTSPPSAEAESASPIESKEPQPSTTTAAVADVPQQSLASAQDTTSPLSAETKSTAPFAPVLVFNPSSTRSALEDISKSRLPSASAPDTPTPLSTEAESPAPAQPEAVKSSSTAPSLSSTTKTQQTPASAASPRPPPAQPNGPLTAPNAVQHQQPLAPATAPQPSSAQPSRPHYSAEQLTSNPYGLEPTYKPVRDERVPPEIAKYVGNYQGPSCDVLLLLAQHGGRNYNPPGSEDGVPLFKKLDYYDYFQNERSMDVERDTFKDHIGWSINIPRITCNQYLDLYNSMIHRNPDNLSTICRQIFDKLEIAIVNRAAVYKWYESLPPSYERVKYNTRHLAFLQMFEKLESAINRYLHTERPQLIRR